MHCFLQVLMRFSLIQSLSHQILTFLHHSVLSYFAMQTFEEINLLAKNIYCDHRTYAFFSYSYSKDQVNVQHLLHYSQLILLDYEQNVGDYFSLLKTVERLVILAIIIIKVDLHSVQSHLPLLTLAFTSNSEEIQVILVINSSQKVFSQENENDFEYFQWNLHFYSTSISWTHDHITLHRNYLRILYYYLIHLIKHISLLWECISCQNQW